MYDISSQKIAQDSLEGRSVDHKIALKILGGEGVDFLPLLDAAFKVRQEFWGKKVLIHVLNNIQNGYCPEDCSYCAQSKNSKAPIEEYAMKSDEEILSEAKLAYENGAYRYCMVFSGRGSSENRVAHLIHLIKQIKERYPLEVCVSPGILDEENMRTLKEAGLDRINHNINTSRSNYSKICTTHSYEDRIQTLKAANASGLDICSGVIIGMGETHEEIIEMSQTLGEYAAKSIPMNFFIPIPGTPLKPQTNLTPEFCLRVLCVFRLLNPRAEIRIAAGREFHLRHLQAMALYPANSLFLSGYLNAKGESDVNTLQMIKDAGFTIESEQNIDDLLKKMPGRSPSELLSPTELKGVSELRPTK